MRVDHNKYRLFIYGNHLSDTFQLGDVVYKDSIEEGSKVGVIIQTHDSMEFRTDTCGNCHISEITFAHEAQILDNRPELLDISKTISLQKKYINLLEVSNGDLRISINGEGKKMFHKQLEEKLSLHEAFYYILGDVAEHLGLKFCHSARQISKELGSNPIITGTHEVISVKGKLKWVKKEDGTGKWWEWKRTVNFIKYLLEDGEVIFELKN